MKGKNTCSECLKSSKKWFEENCVDGRYKKYADTYKKHQRIGYEKRRKLKLYTRLLKVFYYILEGENKMKNFQIWESDFNQHSDRGGMLIPVKEISQMVDLTNISVCSIADLNVAEIDNLNQKLKGWNPLMDEEDLREFLTEEGYKFGSIDFLSDSEKPEELVCIDFNNKQFDDLNLFETYPWYQWWNGSNQKEEWAGENVTVTKVSVEDDKYLDLDMHDGNDWCTGGVKFYHETVYKVVALDGSKVDNVYMLCQWTQWQGDHETAKIMTKDELDAHLKEINYYGQDENEED